MTLAELLSYLTAGRVSIFMLQMNMPLRRVVAESRTLSELLDCDLCLGFWVYLGISILSRQRIEWTESRVVNFLATASMSAFVMHIFRIGWEERFR